jgi:hypothetical protein
MPWAGCSMVWTRSPVIWSVVTKRSRRAMGRAAEIDSKRVKSGEKRRGSAASGSQDIGGTSEGGAEAAATEEVFASLANADGGGQERDSLGDAELDEVRDAGGESGGQDDTRGIGGGFQRVTQEELGPEREASSGLGTHESTHEMATGE